MKKCLLLIILVLFSVSAVSQVENEIFSDNFEGYQDGSDGFPVWNITKGDWITKDGMFYQKSLEYDCGAMLDLFIDYSFVFEVLLSSCFYNILMSLALMFALFFCSFLYVDQ